MFNQIIAFLSIHCYAICIVKEVNFEYIYKIQNVKTLELHFKT